MKLTLIRRRLHTRHPVRDFWWPLRGGMRFLALGRSQVCSFFSTHSKPFALSCDGEVDEQLLQFWRCARSINTCLTALMSYILAVLDIRIKVDLVKTPQHNGGRKEGRKDERDLRWSLVDCAAFFMHSVGENSADTAFRLGGISSLGFGNRLGLSHRFALGPNRNARGYGRNGIREMRMGMQVYGAGLGFSLRGVYCVFL